MLPKLLNRSIRHNYLLWDLFMASVHTSPHHTWYLAYLDDHEYPQFPSDAYPVLFDVYHTLIEDP
jgi:hypothetical protein